jgi:hypothetical protein
LRPYLGLTLGKNKTIRKHKEKKYKQMKNKNQKNIDNKNIKTRDNTMTNFEIIARAIAAALEENPETIMNRLAVGVCALPPAVQAKLNTPRPAPEAAALLETLKKEKTGILLWLVEGSVEALSHQKIY